MFCAGATLDAKLLKTLEDAEKHDMHVPDAGVLHTSSSIHLPHTVRDAMYCKFAPVNLCSTFESRTADGSRGM